ncbi:MAG TPA: poly-gamma-glutamate biosynthesis protein PgsC [Firmicutes bacterium]|nr:poly-gamma-glutamate biosynthesis protein PgsC [Bacillota bacterium]
METRIGIGIVTSIFITELFGVSPGGMIVPAYLSACIPSPERIMATLVVAFMTAAICRFMSRYLLLFGRRRFSAMIVTGLFLRMLLEGLISHTRAIGPEWTVVGYVVPGLIATDFDRQGVLRTIAAMVVALTFLELVRSAFSI